MALGWVDPKVWVCFESPLPLHNPYGLTILVAIIIVVVVMNFWAVPIWLMGNDLPGTWPLTEVPRGPDVCSVQGPQV